MRTAMIATANNSSMSVNAERRIVLCMLMASSSYWAAVPRTKALKFERLSRQLVVGAGDEPFCQSPSVPNLPSWPAVMIWYVVGLQNGFGAVLVLSKYGDTMSVVASALVMVTAWLLLYRPGVELPGMPGAKYMNGIWP